MYIIPQAELAGYCVTGLSKQSIALIREGLLLLENDPSSEW